MRTISVLLVGAFLSGCTTTKVIEATWNQETVGEILSYGRAPAWAMIPHSRNPLVQVPERGPVIRTPFMTADSLYLGSGHTAQDVREIAIRVPRKYHVAGTLIGSAAGFLIGGFLGKAFVESSCWDLSRCDTAFSEGFVTGASIGTLIGGALGYGLLSNGMETIRYRFGQGTEVSVSSGGLTFQARIGN